MITKKNSLLATLILAITLLTSCDSNRIYDESFKVDSDGWHSDDIKSFSFDIQDTVSALSLYINVRTSTDYPYSNMYLFLHSEYADGYSDKDTLEFILAQPDGKWLGESSGTVVENKMLISRGGRFATAGKYTFKIEHAMREDILPEVLDVGFRVELMEVE
ncbi:MAG: gliding motility lipoprotein GldH [Crocinitomicaceae bacterium]